MNYMVLLGKSVAEHCKKVIGVLVGISKSMSQYSGRTKNLVENAYGDLDLIYATKHENVIQELQLIADKQG